jgi:hypothetical protein
MGIKPNASGYSYKKERKTLWDELVEIERIDTRERHLHPLCQQWADALERAEGLAMSSVATYNWLAGLDIEILPNKVVYLRIPEIMGSYPEQLFATWLPRMLPAALKAFKCHHVQIAGLKGWQWPPDDTTKAGKEKAAQDGSKAKETHADIPM